MAVLTVDSLPTLAGQTLGEVGDIAGDCRAVEFARAQLGTQLIGVFQIMPIDQSCRQVMPAERQFARIHVAAPMLTLSRV